MPALGFPTTVTIPALGMRKDSRTVGQSDSGSTTWQKAIAYTIRSLATRPACVDHDRRAVRPAVRRAAAQRRAGPTVGLSNETPPLQSNGGVSQGCRRRPTLPRPLGRSTIGAVGLNDRVRDGNGCGPYALVASEILVNQVLGSWFLGDYLPGRVAQRNCCDRACRRTDGLTNRRTCSNAC